MIDHSKLGDLRIALLQLLPGKVPDEQLDKGIEGCRKAKDMRADIALFPEMWNNGYVIPQDETELESLAVSEDSDFINSFRLIAEELKIAVGITFLEKHEPNP